MMQHYGTRKNFKKLTTLGASHDTLFIINEEHSGELTLGKKLDNMFRARNRMRLAYTKVMILEICEEQFQEDIELRNSSPYYLSKGLCARASLFSEARMYTIGCLQTMTRMIRNVPDEMWFTNIHSTFGGFNDSHNWGMVVVNDPSRLSFGMSMALKFICETMGARPGGMVIEDSFLVGRHDSEKIYISPAVERHNTEFGFVDSLHDASVINQSKMIKYFESKDIWDFDTETAGDIVMAMGFLDGDIFSKRVMTKEVSISYSEPLTCCLLSEILDCMIVDIHTGPMVYKNLWCAFISQVIDEFYYGIKNNVCFCNASLILDFLLRSLKDRKDYNSGKFILYHDCRIPLTTLIFEILNGLKHMRDTLKYSYARTNRDHDY
jgi:hypothetical protein